MQNAKCKKVRRSWRDPFLHSAFCILHLLFLSCATDSIGDDLELRSLATGSYASAQSESARAILVRSEAEYARVWKEDIGSAERPPIDFDKESVVILLAGMRRSGGYSVEVRGVKSEGRVLVVDAIVKSPPPDAIVTMALTSPFAVIAVNTNALDSVRWDP